MKQVEKAKSEWTPYQQVTIIFFFSFPKKVKKSTSGDRAEQNLHLGTVNESTLVYNGFAGSEEQPLYSM